MREIRRDDDGALLGYVRQVEDQWEPLTVFSYPLADAVPSEDLAEDEVRRHGLERLAANWEFRQDGEWYRCLILEATSTTVRVRPTDYRYPHQQYAITLQEPNPATLRPE
jgi:hypothetical protein